MIASLILSNSSFIKKGLQHQYKPVLAVVVRISLKPALNEKRIATSVSVDLFTICSPLCLKLSPKQKRIATEVAHRTPLAANREIRNEPKVILAEGGKRIAVSGFPSLFDNLEYFGYNISS